MPPSLTGAAGSPSAQVHASLNRTHHGWSPKRGETSPQGVKGKVLVAQLHPTLCDPMGCSLPGFSVHGILQASILVAMPSSRGSSRPGSHALQADALLSEPQGKPMVLRLTLGKRLLQKCGGSQFCYMVKIHVT